MPESSKDKKWLEYQRGSFEAIKKLFPNSNVEHDVKVVGKFSGGKRQIDVCVDRSQDSIKKVIECKDYTSKSIDTPKVDSLLGNLIDTGAESGAYISNTPYTQPAKNFASKTNIDLLHLIDAENPNVKVKIGIPIGIKELYIRNFRIKFSSDEVVSKGIYESETSRLSIQIDGSEIPVAHLVKYLWEECDSLSREVGNYEYQPPKQKSTIFLTDGETKIALTQFSIIYQVEAKYYLSEVGTEKAKGIYNAVDKSFTSADTLLTEKFDVSNLENAVETDENFNGEKISIMIGLVAGLNLP